MESIFWLVVFLVLLIIEIFTLGLTTIWFALGAIGAFVSTLFHAEIIVQVVIFFVVSVVSLIVTRPIALKYFSNNTVKTNVEEIIGKQAIITESILDGNNNGKAKLNGEMWIARSEDGSYIQADETVEIVAVEGVKLIVKKIN
jgi:membrane protein implicated in regulation of membrane protease activity